MSSLKERIAADSLIYAGAAFVAQGIGIAIGFAVRHFLGPTLMGSWNLLELALTLASCIAMGLHQAMASRILLLSGRKEAGSAARTRDAGFTLTLILSLLLGLLLILWALLSYAALGLSRLGFFALFFSSLSTGVYGFYLALAWAEKRFIALAQTAVLNAALYFSMNWVLTSGLKLNGLLTALTLSNFISAVFLYFILRSNVSFSFKDAFLLIKSAGPLIGVGLCQMVFMGIDRIVVSMALGVTALGHYSVALFAGVFLNLVPRLISVVIFPSLQEHHGRTGAKKELGVFVITPTFLLAYGMPLFLAAAYFTGPYLVERILPEYRAGIDAMRVMILGAYFMALSQPSQKYLMAVGKNLQHGMILIGAMTLSAVGSLCLAQGGFGLEGVATALAAGFLLYCGVLILYVFRDFYSGRESVFYFAEILSVYAYFILALLGLERWIRLDSGSLSLGARLTGSFILSVPLFWRIEKKTGALGLLWNAVRNHAKN